MIRIQYSAYYSDEMERELGKYIVSLAVVSVHQAKTTDAYDSALRSFGWTVEEIARYGEYAEYQMLLEYGTYAHLWESSGNNLSKLMRGCRNALRESDFLFGFAMDRTENAIGTTGWDAVKGDTLAPLRLYHDDDAPNVQLMRKLDGGV